MRALEIAVEWLRPLIQAKSWDYCVVWRLGDDPSRFIEWMGCCCSAGNGSGDRKTVKEDKDAEGNTFPLCRDAYIQHPARSRACETLAQFPSFMPLYSGIHGEVAISNQPRWDSHVETSNSKHSRESAGTQVLIPVGGGLIELFNAKHVPKDQKTIDFILNRYNRSLEHEAISTRSPSPSLKGEVCHSFISNNFSNCSVSLPYINLIPQLQLLPPLYQPTTHPSFDGSATCSNPFNENASVKSSSAQVSPNQSVGKSLKSRHLNCDKKFSATEQNGLVLGCSNSRVKQKDNLKSRHGTVKEHYQAKNLVTERNRRNRIRDGLFALRALVPKITKMDRAAILGDAVDYIKELQTNVKEFQDELREMAGEECNENTNAKEVQKLQGVSEGTRHSSSTWHSPCSSLTDEQTQMEVQVEVNQIGKRDFLLKIICSQKRGGVVRLIEAINSLGLQVLDANIATFNGRVLNILRVEANKKEFEPKTLQESLKKLTSWTSQTVDGKSTKKRSWESTQSQRIKG